MRILLVHQNFPGQFRHLAPALAARGHQVLGLTQDSNAQAQSVPVLKYKWSPPRWDPQNPFTLARNYGLMTYRGQVVARAARELRDTHGFTPDVVFGTPGWGETMFLPDVWPKARHLVYSEFYYGPDDGLAVFDPEFANNGLDARIAKRANAQHLVMALNAADAILTPTRWQASSHPAHMRDRITVIHEGIDTARVMPRADACFTVPDTAVTLTRGDEVVTLVNRNLEPSRGFHVFMRSLPAVLAARPKAHAVIVGGDAESYSPKPPGGGTWRQKMLDEAGDKLDLARVHFTGQLPYSAYLDLLSISRAHCYLTYPFVLSWSMLEAMSAGCLVIGSRTPPVEEVIEDGVNGRLIGFFDLAGWSEAMTQALAEPERFEALRGAARRTVVERYDLQSICLPQIVSFVEGG